MVWGMLASDTIVSQRSQQNLGLAAAVSQFDDLAVPRIGGLKQSMDLMICAHVGRPRCLE
ncbi:hypothetical protein J2Z84_005027 [Agrobacterium rubi]|nr:hypothetical protein [Agrobacterium rubi]